MNAIERILTPENLQFMIKGAGYSVLVAVCALAGGSVLGLLSAMAKMGKGEAVRTETLIKICKVLDCKIDDIIDYNED